MDVDVWSTGHLAADRFRVRLAAGAGGLGALDVQGVRLDVQVMLESGWSSLVVGEADTVSLDPLQGLLDVEGRDLSALLIDSRVDETFANRTASEIAGVLAGRHGLGAAVAATTTLVGRYYQSDHERVTMGQSTRATSEWDLLCFLAAREGFGVSVVGDVLRFGPEAGGSGLTVRPGDCVRLQLEHSLGMARSIEVTVRSWDQQGAAAVVQSARGGGGGRAWRHGIVRPNLPADEAQRLAERTLADLVRHEWTVSIGMPGELSMRPGQPVWLEGTGTAWDRVYAVESVTRHVDVRRGFTQDVRLQGAG